MNDSNAEKLNEDPYLEKIFSIIAEIPKEVRPSMFMAIPSIKNPCEIHKYHENVIISSTQKELQRVWEANRMTEKINKLKELEANSAKEPAWRPTTGKCEANTVIAAALLEAKEELQKYLESLEEETAGLKSYLKKMHEKAEQQLTEINALQETYKNDVQMD